MTSETVMLLLIGYGAVGFMIAWMNQLGWVDARWVLAAPVWPLAALVLLVTRLTVPLFRDALTRRPPRARP